MKKLLTFVVICALLVGAWFAWNNRVSDIHTNDQNANRSFDKAQYSLDDPDSIWVIANKHRPLQPTDYTPSDLVVPDIPLRLTANDDEMLLRKEAATALASMYAAAKQDGLTLMVSSAYRSYDYQKGLYTGYVNRQGQAVADTQSARPGHSEHQTGLAVDVEPASRECEIEECFGDLPEGKWVAANAYKYGFVIRYAQDKQGITGYIYEPWHLRYVGKPLAAEIHKQSNPTLEEFFGLEAAPDYR